MYYVVEVFINSLGNLPDITIEQNRFTIQNIWMSDSKVTARAIEKTLNSELGNVDQIDLYEHNNWWISNYRFSNVIVI